MLWGSEYNVEDDYIQDGPIHDEYDQWGVVEWKPWWMDVSDEDREEERRNKKKSKGSDRRGRMRQMMRKRKRQGGIGKVGLWR